jgi:two-component system OmpR family sensor kinase
MKPSVLLRRLWRSQLRLRVLAGVVIVTLLAIVAFDIGAVATMRRYLLAQTDQNLQVALALTRIQLPLLVPGYPPQVAAVTKQGRKVPVSMARGGSGASAVTPRKAPPTLHSLLGEFDIAYLPQGGKAFQLEVGAYGPAGQKLVLPANIARLTATAGPRTVFGPNGRIQIRVNGIRVAGGTLVAGTGLYQVDKTMDRVELIIAVGSIAVVLLIGAGVFLVLRRGLRPIESMAAQADRITAGDLTERVTPHSSRSEVGRLGSALNGMLARIEADVQ